MAEKILILRDAMLSKLIAKGKATTARYVPYAKPDSIKDGKWIVAIQNESSTQNRNVDTKDILTLDLVYQRALPDPTAEQPDPLENNTFIDGCINEAGTVKALFRENGELRGVQIGGCVQTSMPDQPLYQPDHLINHLIFSSVVRVEFRFEQES